MCGFRIKGPHSIRKTGSLIRAYEDYLIHLGRWGSRFSRIYVVYRDVNCIFYKLFTMSVELINDILIIGLNRTDF